MNSRSLYAAARLSSVTLVHPTQAVVIFGNFSTSFGTLATKNFAEIVRPSGELNITGVAKYSDFGPIEGISRNSAIGGIKRKRGSQI